MWIFYFKVELNDKSAKQKAVKCAVLHYFTVIKVSVLFSLCNKMVLIANKRAQIFVFVYRLNMRLLEINLKEARNSDILWAFEYSFINHLKSEDLNTASDNQQKSTLN